LVVPSLIRHSYRENESVQMTIRKLLIPSYRAIKPKIIDIEIAISTPLAITYSSDVSIEQVIRLYFIEL
jgi:hypothetical protein